jgi:hypothetical protein
MDDFKSSHVGERPEHNYGEDIRQLCLSLLLARHPDESVSRMSVSHLEGYRGAPDRATLYRWLQEEFSKQTSNDQKPVKKGRHDYTSLLRRDQLDAIGGFMLWRLKIHRPPHVFDVQSFCVSMFGLDPLDSWVSRHMRDLGFSKHSPQRLDVKYAKLDKGTEAPAFLEQVVPVFWNLKDKSEIVAMDQICFWDCGLSGPCYGVKGG